MTERDNGGRDRDPPRWSDRDPRDLQADLHGDDRSFNTDPPPGPAVAGRPSARGADYSGRGLAGGYGQNGSDPGRRVSAYGDRVYRGGGGGGGRAADYDRTPTDADARYGASPPQAYASGAGHRGLGPKGYTRSDARINEDVHDHLTEDDHIDASGISVAVQDGEVTLSGTVGDRRDKHHAEAIVEHIAGVKHVQNNLRVGASNPPLGENTALRDQTEGES
ncbi:MAG: BON domain-containing protein [Pseudomonadota bacterium]